MSHYFFRFIDEEGIEPDDQGAEFVSLSEAKEAVVTGLKSLLADLSMYQNTDDGYVEILDARGSVSTRLFFKDIQIREPANQDFLERANILRPCFGRSG